MKKKFRSSSFHFLQISLTAFSSLLSANPEKRQKQEEPPASVQHVHRPGNGPMSFFVPAGADATRQIKTHPPAVRRAQVPAGRPAGAGVRVSTPRVLQGAAWARGCSGPQDLPPSSADVPSRALGRAQRCLCQTTRERAAATPRPAESSCRLGVAADSTRLY